MPPILLALLLVTLFTVGCWYVYARWEPEWVAIGGILGVVVSIALLIVSFSAPSGAPHIDQTTHFLIERTTYRAVVSAYELERTYKDAYTMTHLSDIVAVKRVTQHNAWGIDLNAPAPTLEVVFREAGQSSSFTP